MSGRPHGAGVEAPPPSVPAVAAVGWCLAGGGIGGSYATVAAAAFARTPMGRGRGPQRAAARRDARGLRDDRRPRRALVGAGITGGRPARLAPAAAFATGAAVALLGATLARRVAR